MPINEKNAEAKREDAKWLVRAGILLVIVAFLVLITDSQNFGFFIFFIMAASFCIVFGKREIRKIETFYEYKELIGDKNEIRISDLAEATRGDILRTVSDLDWMIRMGFWEDVEIDTVNEFFRRKNHYKWNVNNITPTESVSIRKQEEEYYSEVCDCCGGATKIRVGGGGVCDYCGAPIGKYKKYDTRKDD